MDNLGSYLEVRGSYRSLRSLDDTIEGIMNYEL